MTLKCHLTRIARFCIAILFPLATVACSGAPDCNADKTKGLLEQSMNEVAIDSMWGDDFRKAARYSLRNVRKLAYDKESDIYTCSAAMVVGPKDPSTFDFVEVESQISYSVFSFEDEKSKFGIRESGIKEGLFNGFNSFTGSPAARRLAATRAEEKARQAKEYLKNEQEADAGVVAGACVVPRKAERTTYGLSHATVYGSLDSSNSIGHIADPATVMLVADRQGIYAQRAYVAGVEVRDVSYNSAGAQLSDARIVNGWIRIENLRAVDSSRCASLPLVERTAGIQSVIPARASPLIEAGACVMGKHRQTANGLEFVKPIPVFSQGGAVESTGTMQTFSAFYAEEQHSVTGRVRLMYAPGAFEDEPKAGTVLGWVNAADLEVYEMRNCQ